MAQKLPWKKSWLFIGVLFISSCSISSESVSLKEILHQSAIKSSTPKCKEGDFVCCKKTPERCPRTRPII
ncbi:hypothetical protein [Runella limosa]|uniref:hypothetical protein n=1 Tax=Runella limosa TaxID=370978 RepID=UPI00040C719C|nr:hypothetical protein [Runella limosa]